MSKRKVSNPLALAVLGLLFERPMHPYQMSCTMRARRMEQCIKLNYGSLYSVIDRLHANGLIEAGQTARSGRRPERTVYSLTEAGGQEFRDWLAELLSTPVKEYTQFGAGLALLAGLPVERVVELFEQRSAALAGQLADIDDCLAGLTAEIPRVFLVEIDYVRALKQAELDWVRALLADIAESRLDGLQMWQSIHAAGQPVHPAALPTKH